MDTLLDPHDVDHLRTSLREIGYHTDAVLEAIGESGQRGLTRMTTRAASDALAGRDDPLAALVRLWPLQQQVEAASVGPLPWQSLCRAGILERVDGPRGDRLVARVDLRPYGSPDDGADGWVVSDLVPGLDHHVTPTRPDYVLGVSPASTSLAQMTIRTPVSSALDLGCGCGVQSLHLARHAERVVATDVNPRALAMAQLSLALSGVEETVTVRRGSLFEPTPERFDLIVTNPPYVMSPPSGPDTRLTYRESGWRADGLVEAVVRSAPDHLTESGTLQVLANWAHVGDQPWEERLAGWVGDSGCDLWVVERESLDVHEYVELWLTDAGLDGSPRWAPAYREWLDYFTSEGITGVSMGWITLTRAGREHPDLSFEQWPWQVDQPVSEAVAGHRAGVDAALLDDEAILARRWRLRDDVVAETTGRPGAADPEHLVLRQRRGLCRAIEVGTASGGVLGACDGELPLAAVVGAVAQILGAGVGEVAQEVLPVVRRGLREGLLVAADEA